jgi:hypothetical protein
MLETGEADLLPPSSSSSAKESNFAGLSSPHSLTAHQAVLQACLLSFRTHSFLLRAWFAT